MANWRTLLARLFALGCVTLGVLGLIAGATDNVWKLGTEGYFTGGTLLN